MSKPVIFVSAVSRELKSARQLVANTLTFLGYEPEWQDIFGAEQGDLRGMLRRRVDTSAGVVQIVGRRYGAEPPAPDETFGRVSYTQYEALYARQRGKRVWYLLLDDGFPTDPCDAEPAELARLQEEYRHRITADDHLFHPLSSTEGLEGSVLKLRDELTELRRRGKQWAALVIFLLLVCAGLGAWMVERSRTAERKLDTLRGEMSKLREGINQYAGVLAQVQQQEPGLKPGLSQDLAYEELAHRLGVDPKRLRTELSTFAPQLQRAPDATPIERANAAFVARDYAEAERLALIAGDEARKAGLAHNADIVKAYELAGQAAAEHIRYADALRHLREAEKLTDRRRDPAEWARIQSATARILDLNGSYHQAGDLLQQVVQVQSAVLGAEDPEVLLSRLWLGIVLNDQGKYAAAEAELHAVVELETKIRGPEHADTRGIL